MLHTRAVENYRSLRSIVVPLGKLNVIQGANGSGKSNLYAADVLLLGGTGASPNDVKAFEAILKDQHVNYTKVNSSQLNGMSKSQMRGYRLLLVSITGRMARNLPVGGQSLVSIRTGPQRSCKARVATGG